MKYETTKQFDLIGGTFIITYCFRFVNIKSHKKQERGGQKMSDKKLKEAMDEMHDIIEMLKKEGKTAAECSYMEVVYSRLLLIDDSLRVLRTILCLLFGFLVAHFAFA